MSILNGEEGLVADAEGVVTKAHGLWRPAARRAGIEQEMDALLNRYWSHEILYEGVFCPVVAGLKTNISLDDMHELARAVPHTHGAYELFSLAKQRYGNRVGIITASVDPLAAYLERTYGIPHVIANNISDYFLNGGSPVCSVNDKNKGGHLAAMADAMQTTPEKLIVIGDGPEDLSMLDMSGLPVAYHARPEVEKLVRSKKGIVIKDGILDDLRHEIRKESPTELGLLPLAQHLFA